MIHRRPILCATTPVVPEPANESRTQSPGVVEIVMMRSRSFSGFGVSKDGSPGNNARISFFDVRLLPTSSLVHSVRTTRSETSER